MFAGVNRRNGGRAPESEKPRELLIKDGYRHRLRWDARLRLQRRCWRRCNPISSRVLISIQEVEIMESQLFFEGANARECHPVAHARIGHITIRDQVATETQTSKAFASFLGPTCSLETAGVYGI